MNSVLLWMQVNKLSDYDAFHCVTELLSGEMACGFCTFCGVDERYNIQLRVRQRYRGGFELWKDWEDWEDKEFFLERLIECNTPTYRSGVLFISKDRNLWEGVFKNGI